MTIVGIMKLFKNFFMAGLITILSVLILQLPLVKNILKQNYKESYSAYQDTFINHIVKTIDEFGIVILIFVAIGIIYTLCCKKHKLQRLIGDIDKIVSEKNVEFSIFASSDVLSDNILELLETDNIKKALYILQL